jgi:hydroxyacylglutathione hydrolase
MGSLPVPTPLNPSAFAERMEEALVLDTRMELGFTAAHVPGSVSIWLGRLASFAGWFLPYEQPILLVNEADDPTLAVRHLVRLGYDNLVGSLSGGMLAWHTSGRRSALVETITVQELCHRLDTEGQQQILDIRSDEELAKNGHIAGALHIHITQLPQRLEELPRDQPVYIFCGSGLRSTIVASLLKRRGMENLRVVLGGLAGWNSTTCPIDL